MMDYIMSVVIPLYNTELYLEETIESVFKQSLGIENIQVILVNDASTDGSALICQRYAKEYSNNFEYIELEENRGVSHARNVGMQVARGKYITFLDSDDMWTDNAFERAVLFLENNETQIDMVSANIESFGKFSGSHILNISISEDRIIDIARDYKMIRTNGPACIMRTEVAKKYSFDETQEYWEDTKFINQVLMQKQKYGMLTDVVYFYRRRITDKSATQISNQKKGYYLKDLEKLFFGICGESIKQCGEFIPMMQFLLAYALGYRFKEEVTILSLGEMEQYNKILKKILKTIDDTYLIEIPNADSITKVKMIMFKYDIDFAEGLTEIENNKKKLADMSQNIGKLKINYTVLKRWYQFKQRRESLEDYFVNKNIYSIAIYGMSDLGKYLAEELEKSKIVIKYAIDRRADKIEAKFPILTMEQEFPQVDAIIITAVFYKKQIIEQLQERTKILLISLDDII